MKDGSLNLVLAKITYSLNNNAAKSSLPSVLKPILSLPEFSIDRVIVLPGRTIFHVSKRIFINSPGFGLGC